MSGWDMKFPGIILAASLLLGVNNAYASIQIMATRIIFDEMEKEQTIRVNNMGANPSLTQVWLESEKKAETEDTASKEDLTFVISPPVSRINAGKGKTFRVFKTEDTKGMFASDRETMLWVNVLDIPPEADNLEKKRNRLNFAFRTRIKFFYRPVGLRSDPITSAEQLTWSLKKTEGKIYVIGKNENPFHVSMAKMILVNGGERVEIAGEVIKPYESNEFLFKISNKENKDLKLIYTYITDLGSFVQKEINF